MNSLKTLNRCQNIVLILIVFGTAIAIVTGKILSAIIPIIVYFCLIIIEKYLKKQKTEIKKGIDDIGQDIDDIDANVENLFESERQEKSSSQSFSSQAKRDKVNNNNLPKTEIAKGIDDIGQGINDIGNSFKNLFESERQEKSSSQSFSSQAKRDKVNNNNLPKTEIEKGIDDIGQGINDIGNSFKNLFESERQEKSSSQSFSSQVKRDKVNNNNLPKTEIEKDIDDIGKGIEDIGNSFKNLFK